jgi:FkbM family methyltransferase
VIRRSAPFLCKFITLEDGFDFLARIRPSSWEFSALDIGANDGTSIRMIRQYMPDSKIVAFDPVTQPKFDLSGIEFHAYALGSKPDEFDIFTPTIKGYRLTQYSSFEKEKLINQITHDLGVTEEEVLFDSKHVKVVDLDSLGLSPFFMKIDVEGFEIEVLEGAIATIRNYMPVILIEIQSDRTYQRVKDFLGNLGYIAVLVNPKRNLSSARHRNNLCEEYDPSYNNYVWISGEKSPTWAFKY